MDDAAGESMIRNDIIMWRSHGSLSCLHIVLVPVLRWRSLVHHPYQGNYLTTGRQRLKRRKTILSTMEIDNLTT